MTSEITSHHHTIERLERLKRQSASGVDYWMAREIGEVLGYPGWREFDAVIDRARSAMIANGADPSHHIVATHRMMEVGGGAKRKSLDYFLTRAACRLIAMNGDPNKPQIAGAQSYFVVQTHRMEQQDTMTADEKRLELRGRVKSAFRIVSGVAQEAGVPSSRQPVFHDARYKGLYGMTRPCPHQAASRTW